MVVEAQDTTKETPEVAKPVPAGNAYAQSYEGQKAVPKAPAAAEPDALNLSDDDQLASETNRAFVTTDTKTKESMFVNYTAAGMVATIYPPNTELDDQGKPPAGVQPSTLIEQGNDGRRQVEKYTYNSDGSKAEVTTSKFDADRRIQSSESVKYDPSGNKIESTSTNYKTDPTGKTIASESTTRGATGDVAGTSTAQYTYDSQGRVTSQVATNYDANGKPAGTQTTDTSYSGNGETIVVVKTVGADGKPIEESTTKTDASGNVVAAKDTVYTERGEITTSVEQLSDGGTRTVQQFVGHRADGTGDLRTTTTTDVYADHSIETSESSVDGKITNHEEIKVNPDGSIVQTRSITQTAGDHAGELTETLNKQYPPGTIQQLSADGNERTAIENLFAFGDGSLSQGLDNINELGKSGADSFATGVKALNTLATNAGLDIDTAMIAIGVYGSQQGPPDQNWGDHRNGVALLLEAGRDPEAMKRLNARIENGEELAINERAVSDALEGDPFDGLNILAKIGDGDATQGMWNMQHIIGGGDADKGTKTMEADGEGTVAGAVPVYMKYSTNGHFEDALRVITSAGDTGKFADGRGNIISLSDRVGKNGERTFSGGTDNLALITDKPPGTLEYAITSVRLTSNDGKSFTGGVDNLQAASDNGQISNGITNFRTASDDGTYRGGVVNVTFAGDDTNHDGKVTVSEGIVAVRYAANSHDNMVEGMRNIRLASDTLNKDGSVSFHGGVENVRYSSDNNTTHGGIDNLLLASDHHDVAEGVTNVRHTSDDGTYRGGIDNLRLRASDDGTVQNGILNVRHTADNGDSYEGGLSNVKLASDTRNKDGSVSVAGGMTNIRNISDDGKWDSGLTNIKLASDDPSKPVSGGITNIRLTSDDGSWSSALSNIRRASDGGTYETGIKTIRTASDTNNYENGVSNIRSVTPDHTVSSGITAITQLSPGGQSFEQGVHVVRVAGNDSFEQGSANIKTIGGGDFVEGGKTLEKLGGGSTLVGAQSLQVLGGGDAQQGARVFAQIVQERNGSDAAVAYLTGLGGGSAYVGAQVYASTHVGAKTDTSGDQPLGTTITTATTQPLETRVAAPENRVVPDTHVATTVEPHVAITEVRLAALDSRIETPDRHTETPITTTQPQVNTPIVRYVGAGSTNTTDPDTRVVASPYSVRNGSGSFNRSSLEQQNNRIEELIAKFFALSQSASARIVPDDGSHPVGPLAQSRHDGPANTVLFDGPAGAIPADRLTGLMRTGDGSHIVSSAEKLFAHIAMLATQSRAGEVAIHVNSGINASTIPSLRVGTSSEVTLSRMVNGNFAGFQGFAGQPFRVVAAPGSATSSATEVGIRSSYTIRTATGVEITIVSIGGKVMYVRSQAGGRSSGFNPVDITSASDAFLIRRRMIKGGGLGEAETATILHARRWKGYKRRQLIGVEIALALLLTSTAIARQLDAQKETANTDESKGKEKNNSYSRASYKTITRPTWLVRPGEDLVRLAEHLFHEAQIGWLIADLNIGTTTESFVDGKRIVELRTRQRIELPVWQDIVEFHSRIAQYTIRPEDLITVVTETAVDAELVEATMSRAMGLSSLGPTLRPVMARTAVPASASPVRIGGIANLKGNGKLKLTLARRAVDVVSTAAESLLQPNDEGGPSAPAVATTNEAATKLRPKYVG